MPHCRNVSIRSSRLGIGCRPLSPVRRRPFPVPRRRLSSNATRTSFPRRTRATIRFVMARGEGAVVEDVDGNRFLDCAAGIAVNSTGHSHPQVVAAIVDQANKFLHMSGHGLLLRAAGAAGGSLQRDRALRRAEAIVLRQLGHRGQRGRDQAGALHDEALRRHRVPRQLPRADDGLAVAHLEPGDSAQGVRAAAGGRRTTRRTRTATAVPWAGGRRAVRPSAWTSSRISCWCTSCRPTKWRRSWWSRSRARAATSFPRRSFTSGCASSRRSTASC